MKTIIAGSRHFTSPDSVPLAVSASGFGGRISEVVSGGCRGVDRLGETWAGDHDIPIKRFPADWDRFGRSAGPRRNSQMAKHADALLAIWDGSSAGTLDMIRKARAAGLEVFVWSPQ